MEWRRAGWIVGEIFGTHDHLAIANFAQRAGVLRGDSNRSAPFLGQTGIVEYQDAIGHRMQSQQALHARFVQRQRVPGRISQQVLQTLDGGSCDHVGDGLTRFMGQVT